MLPEMSTGIRKRFHLEPAPNHCLLLFAGNNRPRALWPGGRAKAASFLWGLPCRGPHALPVRRWLTTTADCPAEVGIAVSPQRIYTSCSDDRDVAAAGYLEGMELEQAEAHGDAPSRNVDSAGFG